MTLFQATSRRLFASVLYCAVASSALADEAMIGKAKIALPVPEGQCKMETSNPSDAAMIAAIKRGLEGHNILLAMYTECNELKDWHEGKRKLLDNFVQVQTLEAYADRELPMTPEQAAKDVCDSMRADGAAIAPDLRKDLDSGIARISKSIKLNETRLLGVLAEEPRVCYAGLVEKLSTEAGSEKVIVAVYGTTLLKGKVIYHYLFAPDAGAGTAEKLLEAEKRHVAAFLAANAN